MKNLTLGLGLDESPPFMMMGRYNPSISYTWQTITFSDSNTITFSDSNTIEFKEQ